MCRAMRSCSELGNRPESESWSRESPLPPPAWFTEELKALTVAVQYAAEGDIEVSRTLLERVRSDQLGEWYLVHGQNSGTYRNRQFRVAHTLRECIDCGSPPSAMVAAVNKRDHYRCRYCGLGLIPIEVLKSYEVAVGSDSFAATAKNNSHGAAIVFRAT